MNTLLDTGFAVIPFPKEILYNFNLDRFLSEQYEFVHSDPTQQFVLGAFGALGNPSSFHHPQIRQLRNSIYEHMLPLFASQFPSKHLQLLIDRFCIRRAKTTVSGETWHRDISFPNMPHIYGGWVNLDSVSQYFSCVPGSHLTYEAGIGFDRVTNTHIGTLIEIPPYHLIVFNERIVHEVRRFKHVRNSYRLFMKYAITEQAIQLFQDIKTILTDQAVPPISTTQIPPMYSKLHLVNHQQMLFNFTQQIKPYFTTDRGANKVVMRFMPSLFDTLGYTPFPLYSPYELQIVSPVYLT